MFDIEYLDKENNFTYHGHSIEILDVEGKKKVDFSAKWDDALQPVKVLVDEKEYFLEPKPNAESLEMANINHPLVRYINTMKLTDLNARKAYLAVIAGLGSGSNPDVWSFHILLIDEAGSVKEDSFKGEDRHSPLYRTMLADRTMLAEHAGPSMGYKNQSLVQWPTIWYPILYPWATTLLGVILCAGGLILRWRERKRKGGGGRQK